MHKVCYSYKSLTKKIITLNAWLQKTEVQCNKKIGWFFTNGNKPHRMYALWLYMFAGLSAMAQPIGIALNTQSIDAEQDGSYTIVFDMACKNYSPDTIKHFNIAFNFEAYFGSQAIIDLRYNYKVVPLGSVANFNNKFAKQPSDSLFFLGGGYLLPHHYIVASFKINLQLNGLTDTLIALHAKVVGVKNGQKVVDYSTNGTDADSNLDNIPSEDEPTYLHFGIVEPIVPNVFTPNGDGINDEFTIKNSTRYNTTFRVYNRWGKTVYHAQNYQGNWNGYYKPLNGDGSQNDITDTALENGTYYYVLNYQLIGKQTKSKYGTISIFR